MANITDEDLDNILDEIAGRIADELGVTEAVYGEVSFGGAVTRQVLFRREAAGIL